MSNFCTSGSVVTQTVWLRDERLTKLHTCVSHMDTERTEYSCTMNGIFTQWQYTRSPAIAEKPIMQQYLEQACWRWPF